MASCKASTHQSGVLQWRLGISAKIFGIAWEAEQSLFDGVGGESVEFAGVGNSQGERLLNNI